MSTRCNIIVKDGCDELIFYRHCDGYPEGVMPLLEKYVECVKSGAIRRNVGQSAGWLIMFGALEYQTVTPDWFERKKHSVLDLPTPKHWGVGAIEPTTAIHGDIEHLYVIDLETCEVHIDPHYEGKFSSWK